MKDRDKKCQTAWHGTLPLLMSLGCLVTAVGLTPLASADVYAEEHYYVFVVPFVDFGGEYFPTIYLDKFDTQGGTRELLAVEHIPHLSMPYWYVTHDNETPFWAGNEIEWFFYWGPTLDGEDVFPWVEGGATGAGTARGRAVAPFTSWETRAIEFGGGLASFPPLITDQNYLDMITGEGLAEVVGHCWVTEADIRPFPDDPTDPNMPDIVFNPDQNEIVPIACQFRLWVTYYYRGVEPGACCTADGCYTVDSDDCYALYGGTWYPGVTCLDDGGDFECPADSSGACCTAERDCIPLDFEGPCHEIYNGTWFPGELCPQDGGDLICPTEGGVCCLWNGDCADFIPEIECTLMGGVWHDGMTCDDVECLPSTETLGACCTSDGECYTLYGIDCEYYYPGSTFYQDETCADDGGTFICPDLPEGACCNLDGCVAEALNQTDCEEIYDGTWYPGENCDTFVCPSGEGACCLPSGGCVTVVDSAECADYNGEYHGGTNCDEFQCPTDGACCIGDECINLEDGSICMEEYGGVFYFGENCDEFTCPSGGACCTFDGCYDTATRRECMTLYAGIWFEGEECATFTCPAIGGACCYDEGDSCVTLLSDEDCTGTYNGFWFPGENCDEFECPSYAGACCTPEGQCVMVADQLDCEDLEGSWYPGELCSNAGGIFNCPDGCPEPGYSGSYCKADIYGADCLVNIADLAALLSNYGLTSGASHDDGDIYPAGGDGAVNLADLAALLAQYGDDCN